jgi:hypothetical protein
VHGDLVEEPEYVATGAGVWIAVAGELAVLGGRGTNADAEVDSLENLEGEVLSILGRVVEGAVAECEWLVQASGGTACGGR